MNTKFRRRQEKMLKIRYRLELKKLPPDVQLENVSRLKGTHLVTMCAITQVTISMSVVKQ